MSEATSEIDRCAAGVLQQMTGSAEPPPDLTLDAATPLVTLDPDLVALVVGRVQAGATAFGDDHPRASITRRIVVPSAALAVLDVIGLVAALATGHVALAAVTAVLLVVLAYLTFAGVRFVRTDPLRVTAEQRARVDAAKRWRSRHVWTNDLRAGPWGRLVGAACSDIARISASAAWTWASVAGQRAATELADILDGMDTGAITLANSDPAPPSLVDGTAGATLIRRAGSIRCYADSLDDLVRRASNDADLQMHLPPTDDQRLTELLAVVRGDG